MATLEVTINTEEKTMSVKVNGESLDSVQSVSVYNWGYRGDTDPHFSVETGESVDGVNRRVCLTAGKKPDPSETVRASKHKGVIEVIKESAAAEGLAELLSAYRGR